MAGKRRTANGSVIVPDRKHHWLFDRPKPPHDWRWVVGGIGKVLIVTGLLMFAFVAYQLWGTGIYTAQAQNRLTDQFHDAGIDATTVPPTTDVTTSTTTATTTGSTAEPGTTPPGTTTTTGPETVPFPFAVPTVGDPVVQLQIPSIGVDYIVVEGVGVGELKQGPGHFPESVLPGQLGNTAIAGHRTTHGAPFYKIDHLRPGDEIVLTYPSIGGDLGPQFTYVVTSTQIVSPQDYALAVPTTDPGKATLALVSCHPITSAKQRMIVHAELDPSRSSPLFAATPLGEASGTDELPGDETTTAPATTAPATSTPTGETAAPTTTIASTLPPATVAPPSASQDAFAGGWFDDGAAWPHIVIWGLLLVAITIGGYVLAKRQRRIWLGVLVSFVPFVVVLYFWFENVNRLLPPGL
ncbi:MAG: sortase [Ilumatobacteraceae bacterium]